MGSSQNFKWTQASNLKRVIYEDSFEKAEAYDQIRDTLVKVQVLAQGEAHKTNKLFKEKIVRGEGEADRQKVGRFLLDQMYEESKLAAAASKLIDEYDRAMAEKKRNFEEILK